MQARDSSYNSHKLGPRRQNPLYSNQYLNIILKSEIQLLYITFRLCIVGSQGGSYIRININFSFHVYVRLLYLYIESTFMTGFWKTNQNVTPGPFHFIFQIILYSRFCLQGPNLCELCEVPWARKF